MAQWDFTEATAKANTAWNEQLNKALEALSLATEANRDLSGRTVDVTAAIAREGIQYLTEVQMALRQASDEARDLWTRQWNLAQEFPKDPMGFPQKAVALSWEGSEKITRLGDVQRQALNRFTGNVQNLLERAGKESQEAVTRYNEKLLALYDLKS
jgi:hypothetical protein